MRALILLSSILVLGLAYSIASFTGMVLAAVLCLVVGALSFVFSTATTESLESKDMQRNMGRNTTFLGKLGKR